MKRFYVMGFALLLAVALAAIPAYAQQISLRGVEPAQGRPGEELELALLGDGFGGEVHVAIGGFDVLDAWVESEQVIRARVHIPEDALPGPRNVEVVVILGQNEEFRAVLEGGFTVLEGEAQTPGPGPQPPGPGPQPPEPGPAGGGDDLDWLPWLVVLVVAVVVAGTAIAVALKAHQSAQRKQWQEQAQEQELTKTCQSGTVCVRREKLELKPGRWRVSGLKVTLYDAVHDPSTGLRAGQRGAPRDVQAELVKRVDKGARDRLLWGDREKLGWEAGEIARDLTVLVVAWQSQSAERDVYVEPKIEGGEASAKFVLYRCVGMPGHWQKVTGWTAKLKAVSHFPTSFRGPLAGESPEAYRALLDDHLRGYVYALIQEAGRLW